MIRAVALAAGLALVALPAAGGARPTDYAALALNVLPPGQSGDLRFPATVTDQLKLYDGLTPRGGNVRLPHSSFTSVAARRRRSRTSSSPSWPTG